MCVVVVLAAMVWGATAQPKENYDVVVYGATPSGVMAALNAAREGQKTALLEPGLYVGGCMSGGLSMTDSGMHAEVIGGSAIEFFQRVAKCYNWTFAVPKEGQCGRPRDSGWVFEPHVAEQVMVDMLREAGVTISTSSRIKSFIKTGTVIKQAELADGRVIQASVYVDSSYEGSLLKLSGASYTFGREANTTYNESCGGRLPAGATGRPFGHTAQIGSKRLNPYTDASNTSLIHGVVAAQHVVPVGAGDSNVGSYDWRVTLTDKPENMVPIPEPAHYDPAEWELLRRYIQAHKSFPFSIPGTTQVPNRKTDWKMFGTFGEPASLQNEYPNATWERQQEIVAAHKQYALGLLHFFRTDPIVPDSVKTKLGKLGLCKDEYNRSTDGSNDHWMSQLYVRTALRMVSETVLTQRDVISTTYLGDQVHDRIGLGSYTVDVPGPVQRIVVHSEDGRHAWVENEGSMQCPVFCEGDLAPYALPYSVMVPKKEEVSNLLVSVAVSASHVAFNAVRLEPIWMVLGQAAGVAAAMAANASADAKVAELNVSVLQDRLKSVGVVLDPPTPPAPPAPPAPLPGSEWLAYIPMWRVGTGSGGISTITATKDKAVLKKSCKSSKVLPPSEVRFFSEGQVVQLSEPPQNSTLCDGDYYLVHVASGPPPTPPTPPTPPSNASKPHFVFVMIDDLGWYDAGFRGNTIAKTPFMDSMVAKDALLITRHYAYKYCSPSRRSFLSGRLPPHVGQVNGPNVTIDMRMQTIADKLASAGYKTHHSGKWHAGFYSIKQTPHGRGFDTSLGFLYGVDHWTQRDRKKVCKGVGENSTDLWNADARGREGPGYGLNGTYGDYLYVGRAVETILKHDPSTPLFYYLATEVAHAPLEAPQRFIDMYDPKTTPNQIEYAFSSIVDEALRNVTTALKAKGMWEHTLMVVASDNGGPAFTDQRAASNYPLRGGKYSQFEGGIRTTAFVTGGFLPSAMRGTNTSSAQVFAVCDWYATFLGLAGVDPRDDHDGVPPVDSIDQWPVLSGQSALPARAEVFVASDVLVQSNYKLITTQTGDARWTGPLYPKVPATGTRDITCSKKTPCLFDVVKDPSERTNIAPEHPDVVAKMQARLGILMDGIFEGEGVPGATNHKVCEASATNGMWLTPFDWKKDW